MILNQQEQINQFQADQSYEQAKYLYSNQSKGKILSMKKHQDSISSTQSDEDVSVYPLMSNQQKESNQNIKFASTKLIQRYSVQKINFHFQGSLYTEYYEDAIKMDCCGQTLECQFNQANNYLTMQTVIEEYLLVKLSKVEKKIKLNANIRNYTDSNKQKKHLNVHTIQGDIQGQIIIDGLIYSIIGTTQLHLGQSIKKDIQQIPWIFKNQKELIKVNKALSAGDFNLLSLCWQNHYNQFCQKIRWNLSHWSQLSYEYQSQYQKLIHVLYTKYINMPMTECIYPGLGKLYYLLQKTLQVKGNRKKIQVNDQIQDLLYQHYIQQIQSKNKREGAYYIRDQKLNKKLPIGQFIANQMRDLTNYNQWKDILTKVTLIKKNQEFRKSQEKSVLNERENRNKYLQQIQNFNTKIIIQTNKICCAPFFNYSWDIQYKYGKQGTILTNRKILDILTKQSEQNKMSKDETSTNSQLKEIMLDICALLNSINGGIILFNTFKNYLNIQIRGQSITEQEKEKVKQILMNQIKNITPMVQIDREIVMSYVPIVSQPYINGFGTNQSQKLYIKGMYVLRIVVKPINHQKIYFIATSNQANVNDVAFIQDQKRVQLKSRNIVKMIKKKFNYHFISEQEDLDEEERLWVTKNNNFSDHICQKPEIGIILDKKEDFMTIVDSKFGDQLQRKYKNITLLVVNKNYHSTIIQKLKEKGIDCDILVRYTKYKLKAANNSAALFHNIRFDQLLSIVSYNKDFEFGGRYILTIAVTEYLKLAERGRYNLMPQEDFDSLVNWPKAEHPNQSLQLWRYQVDQQQPEFYIKTQSKMSTLFMYFVLNHYNEKAIFKGPKGIQKMSDEQKKKRFKLHFPRTKTSQSKK